VLLHPAYGVDVSSLSSAISIHRVPRRRLGRTRMQTARSCAASCRRRVHHVGPLHPFRLSVRSHVTIRQVLLTNHLCSQIPPPSMQAHVMLMGCLAALCSWHSWVLRSWTRQGCFARARRVPPLAGSAKSGMEDGEQRFRHLHRHLLPTIRASVLSQHLPKEENGCFTHPGRPAVAKTCMFRKRAVFFAITLLQTARPEILSTFKIHRAVAL
jgi:hypothetical protein